MKLPGFGLVLLLALVLATPGLGQNQRIGDALDYDFGRFSRGDNISVAEGFRGDGLFLRMARGVILQSFAGFAEHDPVSGQWKQVAESDVTVKAIRSGYCLKIGQAPCAAIPMTAADLQAVKLFATNNHVRGITLATDAGPTFSKEVEKLAAQKGMVKIKGRYKPEIWVSKYFSNRSNITLQLEILDFLPVFTTDNHTIELKEHRKKINAQTGAVAPGSRKILDQSWIVSDFGSKFVLRTENGVLKCSGYPTRAHWQLTTSATHGYVSKLEALGLSSDSKAQYEPEQLKAIEAKLADARWLFCATAMIRTLHKQSPSSISAIR